MRSQILPSEEYSLTPNKENRAGAVVRGGEGGA